MRSLIMIEEVRSEMYDLTHLSALPAIPILGNRDMRRLWSIVSNAGLRSSRTRFIPIVVCNVYNARVTDDVYSLSGVESAKLCSIL